MSQMPPRICEKRKKFKIGSYLLEFKLFQYDPLLGQEYTYFYFGIELDVALPFFSQGHLTSNKGSENPI